MKRIDLILVASVLFSHFFFGLFYDFMMLLPLLLLEIFADKYHFVKDQIFWIVLGLFALGFFSRFNLPPAL